MIELERIAALHWRGTEEERLGGWLLRAAGGFTGRANSALPLGDPGVPLGEALAVVTGWYRSRGLPPMVAVPLPLDGSASGSGSDPASGIRARLDGYLARHGWPVRPGSSFVMAAALPLGLPLRSLPPGAGFLMDAEPDEGWLRFHYRGHDRQSPAARQVLTSAPDQAFASVRSGGDVLAIARLSIARGWAGITAVEVHREHRRAGLGTAITTAVCAEAVARGIGQVFLQVEVDNAAARALYERCGFRYSHRYHYRVAPE